MLKLTRVPINTRDSQCYCQFEMMDVILDYYGNKVNRFTVVLLIHVPWPILCWALIWELHVYFRDEKSWLLMKSSITDAHIKSNTHSRHKLFYLLNVVVTLFIIYQTVTNYWLGMTIHLFWWPKIYTTYLGDTYSWNSVH